VSEAVLRVCVVLALPGNAQVVEVRLAAGATLRDAVAASGVLRPADLASDSLTVGVFSHVRPPDSRVRDGDRIEIYRPLKIDPKEARRLRAEMRRKRKKP